MKKPVKARVKSKRWKAKAKKTPQAVVDAAPVDPVKGGPAKPQPWQISDSMLLRSMVKVGHQHVHPFQGLPLPPPRVLPKGIRKSEIMAFDADLIEANAWAAEQVYNSAFYSGQTFLGYTYLSELAQRAEYRNPTETLAVECTRKWISFKQAGQKPGKSQRVKELEEEMKRLDAQGAAKKMVEYDGFFGRAHLYLDTGDTERVKELQTSIGDGTDDATALKFAGKKGFLKALRPVEPVWCYPAKYDAIDPLKPDWYNPRTWFVQGKEVHKTRLLTFVGREVPDMLKPSYGFGGLSLSQMGKETIDNWLRTRQAVTNMIWTYSITALKTSMSDALGEGGDQVFKRAAMFSNFRTNQGLMMLDKETEEIENISAPLAGLESLLAHAQEQMCSVLNEPVVKLLGIQPAGLNASSEGELKTWYDRVAAFQNSFLRPKLNVIVAFAMLNIWGEVDKSITYDFEQLEELTEKEIADKGKVEADTDVALVGAGILDPTESRTRLAGDPDSPYGDIDPDDVPEMPGAEGEAPLEEEDNMPDLGTEAGQLGARDPEPERRPEEGTARGAREAERDPEQRAGRREDAPREGRRAARRGSRRETT